MAKVVKKPVEDDLGFTPIEDDLGFVEEQSASIEEPGLITPFEGSYPIKSLIGERLIPGAIAASSALESVTGAPTRAGVQKFSETKSVPESIAAFIRQMGKDPSTAPDFGIVGNMAADWTNAIPVLGAVKKAVPALNVAGKAAKNLREGAALLDVAQVGSRTPEIRKILERTDLNELSDFLRQNKLISPGKDIQEVNSRIVDFVNQAGKKVGAIYDKATAAGIKLDPNETFNTIFQDTAPKLQSMLEKNVPKAVDTINSFMGDIKKATNPKELHAVRVKLDKEIKDWSRAPGEHVQTDALRMLRDSLNNILDNKISQYDPKLGKELAKVNKDYSLGSLALDVSDTATTRAMGQMAGKPFGMGLPELITASPFITRAFTNPDQALPALLGGAAAAGTMKGVRKYGPSVGAPIMRGAATALEKGPSSFYRTAKPLTIGSDLLRRLQALEE